METSIEKRFLSLLLAFVLVFSLLPWSVVEVEAAISKEGTSEYTYSASLGVTKTDKSQDTSGVCGYEYASGDASDTLKITADCNYYGDRCTSYYPNTTKVTLTNNTGSAQKLTFTGTLSGGSATIDNEQFDGNGSKTVNLSQGSSCVIVVVSSGDNSTAELQLTITIEAPDAVSATFATGANGSYTVNGSTITVDTVVEGTAATEYKVKATAATGYQFFGWRSSVAGYVSYNAEETLQCTQGEIISPVFIIAGSAIFGVKGLNNKYYDLDEACTAAGGASDKTVYLMESGTLNAGNYTIPAGVTLLIPYNDANTVNRAEPEKVAERVGPSAYRTLTMASGASITVNGELCVSGKQSAK